MGGNQDAVARVGEMEHKVIVFVHGLAVGGDRVSFVLVLRSCFRDALVIR